MDLREEIAQDVEAEIRPLLDKPGFLNAVGTLQLVLRIIREGRK